ncbi:PilZ domain-containing protein [Tardiphaga sp.]|uniref:PilZ domain-containing protein n=1 Tax=Tardiphaga sp. TaxID=1926292 RepID=UPI0037D99CAB
MSVEKFLRQRAVNVVVGGQYTLSNWLDPEGKPRSFACRTSRVSPFRMIVDAPVMGRLGDRIDTYFGDFGKLEGEISDTVSGSFLLELMLTRPQRQKMSDQLTWLEKKQKDPSIKDGRKQARIVPASPHSMLTFADGTMKSCFVIDMSSSGAAVSADVQPEIGTPLAVGACVGRVVRHLAGGFAVKFVEEQGREVLERRVIRPMQAPRALRATTLEQRMDRMEEA